MARDKSEPCPGTRLPLVLLGPSDRLDLPAKCNQSGSATTTILALVGPGGPSEVLFYEASQLEGLPSKLPSNSGVS